MLRKNTFFGKTALTCYCVASALLLTSCGNNFGPYAMPSGYVYHGTRHKAPPGPELIRAELHGTEMATEQPMDLEDREALPYEQSYPPRQRVDAEAILNVETSMEKEVDYAEFEEEMGDGEASVAPVETVMMPMQPEIAPPPMHVEPPSMSGTLLSEAANQLVDNVIQDIGRPSEPVYIMAGEKHSMVSGAFETSLREALLQKGFVVAETEGQSPFVLHHNITELNNLVDNKVLISLSLFSDLDLLSERNGVYEIDPILYQPIESPELKEEYLMDHNEHENNPAINDPLPLMPNG
jgi:hypothetical protein